MENLKIKRVKQLAIFLSLSLLLVACGGGEKETIVVNPSTPTAPANSQASQSCPAGMLKASDGSCTRECTASEVRNAAGVCVTQVAEAPDVYEYDKLICDDTGYIDEYGYVEQICKYCDLLNGVEISCGSEFFDSYSSY